VTGNVKRFEIEFLGMSYVAEAADLEAAVEVIAQQMPPAEREALVDMEEPAYLMPDREPLYIKGQVQPHVWIARPK